MANWAKRIWTESNRLKSLSGDSNSNVQFILESTPFNDDEMTPTRDCFTGRILPMSEPFKQSSFRVELKFTKEYPAKPPQVRILTPIYHPNVSVNGFVCIPILISTEAWQQSIYLDKVLEALVDIIDRPNLSYPMNDEAATEYFSKKDEYDRKALQMVTKNIVPRS